MDGAHYLDKENRSSLVLVGVHFSDPEAVTQERFSLPGVGLSTILS